jgi:hypothetical protein
MFLPRSRDNPDRELVHDGGSTRSGTWHGSRWCGFRGSCPIRPGPNIRCARRLAASAQDHRGSPKWPPIRSHGGVGDGRGVGLIRDLIKRMPANPAIGVAQPPPSRANRTHDATATQTRKFPIIPEPSRTRGTAESVVSRRLRSRSPQPYVDFTVGKRAQRRQTRGGFHTCGGSGVHQTE